MKKILYFIFCLLMVFVMTSCAKDNTIDLTAENVYDYLDIEIVCGKTDSTYLYGTRLGSSCDATISITPLVSGGFNNAELKLKLYAPNYWEFTDSDEDSYEITIKLPANGYAEKTIELSGNRICEPLSLAGGVRIYKSDTCFVGGTFKPN